MKLIVSIKLKFDQLTKTEKQDDIWEYNDLKSNPNEASIWLFDINAVNKSSKFPTIPKVRELNITNTLLVS